MQQRLHDPEPRTLHNPVSRQVLRKVPPVGTSGTRTAGRSPPCGGIDSHVSAWTGSRPIRGPGAGRRPQASALIPRILGEDRLASAKGLSGAISPRVGRVGRQVGLLSCQTVTQGVCEFVPARVAGQEFAHVW